MLCLYNSLLQLYVFIVHDTLKNKGNLLSSMVPWRAVNIHESFPLFKRFFTVEEGFLDS